MMLVVDVFILNCGLETENFESRIHVRLHYHEYRMVMYLVQYCIASTAYVQAIPVMTEMMARFVFALFSFM
jgi:hypothetical protein